jgi:hypothetical protein
LLRQVNIGNQAQKDTALLTPQRPPPLSSDLPEGVAGERESVREERLSPEGWVLSILFCYLPSSVFSLVGTGTVTNMAQQPCSLRALREAQE